MIKLQFLYEKDLKNKFWEFYRNRKSIVKYQFESDARDGGIDLLTIEKYQNEYQICAFEFKLSDIKKALAQAEANLPFVSKSFIVIPAEKEQLIQDKYLSYLKEKHYIGVIGVEQGEFYTDENNIYVLFGIEEPYALTYKNPPDGILWSDIFKIQNEIKIPLIDFITFHVYKK